jgi:gamma-glutamyltranspeptidase/glutathione hydrolase
VTGSPGGSTIITSIAQLLVNVIDFDMDIESSVQSPRFHHQLFPDVIFYEKGAFSIETIKKLLENGYVLKERSSIGSINSIYFDSKSRRIFGSSDNRRNSSAVSY